MLSLMLLAATHQLSAPLVIQLRVIDSCTVSLAGARCDGGPSRQPIVTRQGSYIVYSF